jgi:arylsulfatase A-like enzyme
MRTIVFILRGCPAGWLGAYGNEWVVTPHLDQLASESVVFDRHISDYPDAAGACRAWLGENPNLTEQLRTRGIPTILVRANHPDTDAPDWFYAAWAELFDARPLDEDSSPLDALLRTLPSLLDRLEDQPDFLLWIEIDRLLPPWDIPREVFDAYLQHEMMGQDTSRAEEVEEEETEAPADSQDSTDAHPSPVGDGVEPLRDPPTGPFDPSDPDALAWLSTSFGSVVTILDSEIGAIMSQLRERRLDQSATWIMTSDYGYPLGEHGQLGVHRPWLHEELVHIPLIIRMAAGAEAGRRVQAFTQPPDVAETILDLFHSAPQGRQGLLGLARGETEVLRPRAISTLDLGIAAERAIRTNDWAYLLPLRTPDGETREPRLYKKPDDRWEVNDVRARNIAVTDELESIVKDG